jgi:hypothetical protein
MSKARVEGCYEALSGGQYAIHWNARHECGWWEDTAFWHNAFWAADHHVRYDCGRREQMSSGQVRPPAGYDIDPCPWAYEEDVHAGHIHKDENERKVWCPGPAQVQFTVHKQVEHRLMSTEEYEDKLADAQATHLFLNRAGEAMDRWLNEGGMQIDPRPFDIGDPLPPASAEDPTVELGAITAEVGCIDLGVCEEEGTEEGLPTGEHGGSRGWWPWGRHVRAW